MLEQAFVTQNEDQADSADDASRTNKRRKTDKESSKGDGVFGFVKKSKGGGGGGGIGYAGDQKEDVCFRLPLIPFSRLYSTQNTGQLEAQALQKEKDAKLGSFLSALREFLPNLHRKAGGQASDYLVHPTALAHLRRRFNHICSTLLRNDSLADMSDRSILYFELLNWLEVTDWSPPCDYPCTVNVSFSFARLSPTMKLLPA